MTQHYPIVIERESNGSWSAWVAGLSGVYAAADTAGQVKRGIRAALAAHLKTLRALGREPQPAQAEVLVLSYSPNAPRPIRLRGVGALLGRRTSAAKARAARENGRRGGRPRTARRASKRPARS
jgi:predicted RNase H-like HicB family nuclease